MNRTALAMLAVLGSLSVSTSVQAHATLEQQEAAAGSTYKAVVRVPHGCEGEATLKVRIQIPEGFINVKPQPKPGWTLETVKGAYAKTYDYYGTALSEGVREINWTGELLDEHYDEFVFRGTLDKSLPTDKMLYIPVVQECATGTERWIEIPAEGQDPHDLEGPAPGVMIVPAKQSAH